MSVFERAPDLAPPRTSVGLIGWLRSNLFSSWFNTALTILSLWIIWQVVPPFIDWVFFSSTIAGNSREACAAVSGACWTYVKVWFWTFMFGFYPEDERWRVVLSFAILVSAGAPLFVESFRHKRILGAFLMLGYPLIAYWLFVGGFFGLELVPTEDWGGFFLTLVIAGIGIFFSLPIGIVLALGRRSEMPAVRMLCTVFIEFWRGIPLIVFLFVASNVFQLFLPQGVTVDKLIRALVAVALFASAYMAEVVRGGLQSIPKGQYEAASALGLGYWQSMAQVILPQALKAVIPGIVNTFIGLFKDTTLVAIISLLDLLGRVQQSFNDPDWGGFAIEGYVFTAFVFFIFCYGMSRYSQSVERRLGVGDRR
ncbi:MAG: amino acid ABC transporter permease [Alphaproteobacteria bacterium]